MQNETPAILCNPRPVVPPPGFALLRATLVALVLVVKCSASDIEPIETLKLGRPVSALALSADGHFLAAGDGAGVEDVEIVVWSIAPVRPLFVLRGHTRCVTGLCFTSDNHSLASVSFDGTLRTWELRNGSAVGIARRDPNDFVDVAFVPRKNLLITRSVAEHPLFWDAKDPKSVKMLKEQPLHKATSSWTSVVSKDGDVVATASGFLDRENHFSIRELLTGKELKRLKGHRNGVLCMALSPDAKILATGYLHPEKAMDLIQLWDVEKGRIMGPIKGQEVPLFALQFSPDGKTLAGGDNAGTLALFDVGSRKKLVSLRGHTGQITRLHFTQDGERLISSSHDGSIRIWDTVQLLNRGTVDGDTTQK